MVISTLFYLGNCSPIPKSEETTPHSETSAPESSPLIIVQPAKFESKVRVIRSIDSNIDVQSLGDSNIKPQDASGDLEPSAQNYVYTVYRPLFRYSQISRRTYAVNRPPPLSNYHNDYNEFDKFPTVA